MGSPARGDRIKVGAAKLASAAAIAGAAGIMTWAVRGRSSSVFGPSAHHGLSGRRAVALTFDDGPSPATGEILSILAAYKCPATFFQCGLNVHRNPDFARRVAESGHEIGNHSYTHPNCAFRSPDFIYEEFARAQEAIFSATDKWPSLVRAPYGVRWFGFREMQTRLALQGVMWSVIGRDWKLPAGAIVDRVLTGVSDGAIICLHDGRGTLENPAVGATVEAVRRILPALAEKGYHFETVSQLLCLTT